jgi:hypothetical protein
VEPQVSDLIDQLSAVATVVDVFGSHHRFRGFFANFFQKCVRPFVQQAGDIAFLGVTAVGGFARFNDVGKTHQSVRGIGWVGTHGVHL